MLNLLTARQPYRVHEQFPVTDTAPLLGEGITSTNLTDDAFGRALVKIAQAGGATVFSAATRALLHDQVSTAETALFVHWDSTTRSAKCQLNAPLISSHVRKKCLVMGLPPTQGPPSSGDCPPLNSFVYPPT